MAKIRWTSLAGTDLDRLWHNLVWYRSWFVHMLPLKLHFGKDKTIYMYILVMWTKFVSGGGCCQLHISPMPPGVIPWSHVTNLEFLWMTHKVTSQLNNPGITPTWNASTLSSRWSQLIWMTFLDWPGYLWHEISRWPSSIQRQFWWHGCLIIFPMRTRFQDFPHPCLFVPYMCFVLAFYLSHILQKGYPPPPRVDRPCVLFRIVPA